MSLFKNLKEKIYYFYYRISFYFFFIKKNEMKFYIYINMSIFSILIVHLFFQNLFLPIAYCSDIEDSLSLYIPSQHMYQHEDRHEMDFFFQEENLDALTNHERLLLDTNLKILNSKIPKFNYIDERHNLYYKISKFIITTDINKKFCESLIRGDILITENMYNDFLGDMIINFENFQYNLSLIGENIFSIKINNVFLIKSFSIHAPAPAITIEGLPINIRRSLDFFLNPHPELIQLFETEVSDYLKIYNEFLNTNLTLLE